MYLCLHHTEIPPEAHCKMNPLVCFYVSSEETAMPLRPLSPLHPPNLPSSCYYYCYFHLRAYIPAAAATTANAGRAVLVWDYTWACTCLQNKNHICLPRTSVHQAQQKKKKFDYIFWPLSCSKHGFIRGRRVSVWTRAQILAVFVHL